MRLYYRLGIKSVPIVIILYLLQGTSLWNCCRTMRQLNILHGCLVILQFMSVVEAEFNPFSDSIPYSIKWSGPLDPANVCHKIRIAVYLKLIISKCCIYKMLHM